MRTVLATSPGLQALVYAPGRQYRGCDRDNGGIPSVHDVKIGGKNMRLSAMIMHVL